MRELVSIIMPSFNTGQFIADAIESVINQSYNNWELIIIDDCSRDNTDDVVEYYLRDTRIQYYKNPANMGAAYSRNRALQIAKGKWIAFLDSDDIWHSDKLKKQITFMENNDLHFSYTNYSEMDEEGNPRNVSWTGPSVINNKMMMTFNYMGCLTVMYDSSFIGQIQIKDLKKRNDYAIWLKVVKKSPAYLLKEDLASYRVRKTGSITDRRKPPLDRIKYNYLLWRLSEEKSALASCILVVINIVFACYKKIVYKKVT